MKTLPNTGTSGKRNGDDNTAFPRIAHIRELLGNDVLLLAWPLGLKGTNKKWGHLTLADMAEPAYLRELETGNIGVALGAKSGGLCSIDWDDDVWMEKFLALNPALAGSLRTRGNRGCNVWLRCTGDYPRSCNLKAGNSDLGEWRATGNQTIISGIHPDTQRPYSFIVEAPPVEIEFEAILWPEGLRLPRVKNEELPVEHSHSSHSVTQPTQPTQPRSQHKSGASPLVFEVTPFVPKHRRESDRLLWAMARRVRTWEKHAGRKTTRDEQTALFTAWWPLAKTHVDPAMDYFAFLQKWHRDCKKAKYADDETPLMAAWAAAITQPLPPEATLDYGPEPLSEPMKLLIALCHQLQLAQGAKPFYLGSRDAGKLLGVPHTTVFNWLECLADEAGCFRVLKKVSVGSRAEHRTNEWLYLPLVASGQ